MVSSPEEEAALLRATFKDNDALLKILRGLFFGFELSQAERDLVRGTFIGSELRLAFRKKVYGLMEDDSPIGSVPDYWLNIKAEQLLGASKDAIYQLIQSKAQLLKMFQKAMALLENPDGERVNVAFDPARTVLDDLGVGLLARNLYVQVMETSLHLVKQIANQPEPTTQDQVKKKLTKNSSK